MSGRRRFHPPIGFLVVVGGVVLFGAGIADVSAQNLPSKDVGRAATSEEIAAWDIDIEPDGTGLPPGSGTVAEGKEIYDAQCVICHGPTGAENPGDSGIVPNVRDLYCCATTVYDYIFRAMPYYAPQSLKPDEVYSLVALILYRNELVPEDFVADATTVPAVAMPEAPVYKPNPWTSGVIPQPGDPWSHDNP